LVLVVLLKRLLDQMEMLETLLFLPHLLAQVVEVELDLL
jgi:hypothetical protein